MDQVDADIGQAAGTAQRLPEAPRDGFRLGRRIVRAAALGNPGDIDFRHDSLLAAGGRLFSVCPLCICRSHAVPPRTMTGF
jgi:hypothetical protein